MILQRIMAIAAAGFAVAAAAIALIGPPDISLGAALYMLDGRALDAIQAHAAGWLWQDLVKPVLLRPAWLLPVAIGIVCAGVSLTLASRRQRQNRQTRRRF